MTAAETVKLAEGIEEYLAAVRPAVREPAPSLEVARLLADRNAGAIAVPRPAGMTVADTFIVHGAMETPVRIYRPAAKPASALVYFHGGGFSAGSIETFDVLTAALSHASNTVVLSVGYRRLPEADPAEIYQEARRAYEWTCTHAKELQIDADHVGLAGDSAGAMIALQVAHAMNLDPATAPKPVCLALFYGVFSVAMPPEKEFERGDPVLVWPVLDAIVRTYHECDAHDPSGVFDFLNEDLAAMPPTVLLQAECDPLRTQGETFAHKLIQARVPVTCQTAPAMPHGFLRALRFCAAAREEMAQVGTRISHILNLEKDDTL